MKSLSWKRLVVWALLVLLAACGLALTTLKLRHGAGAPYPDVSTAPLLPAAALETLVTLEYPPGNVAIAADGRLFFNFHPFAKAERFVPATVFELVDGKPRPYPDAAAQARYQGVFGMTVDRQQRLWFIEPAGLDHARTRLLAFDLTNNRQVLLHEFAKGELPFAQDLRVTADGRTVILADTGLFTFTAPGLTVFDIASRTHRTVLRQHAALKPQDWAMRTPFGPHKLGFGLVTFAVGIDGIELSADGQWLYFAAMTHDTLYRLPLPLLLDAKADDAALAAKLEAVAKKPMSDGLTLDREGRVVITDIENGGIARIDGGGRLQTLVKSPRVIWADGVVLAPDGAIVFTDSAIPRYIDQLARPPSAERLAAGRPYALHRLRAP